MTVLDLSKLKKGDDDEWCVAYNLLMPSAMAKARSTGMSRCCTDDAEDVAIASIAVLARKVEVGDVQQVEELRPLLSRIVRDKAIDHCRKLFSQKRGGGKTTSLEGLAESERLMLLVKGDSPLEKLEISELVELIRKVGEQLEDREWSMCEDYFFSELSQKEFSKKYGIAVGSVGVYKKRIADKLRGLLKNFFVR